MLRGLLRDSEAAKPFLRRLVMVGLPKTPELFEKYVIAREVMVELLDVFLSRRFDKEHGFIQDNPSDWK